MTRKRIAVLERELHQALEESNFPQVVRDRSAEGMRRCVSRFRLANLDAAGRVRREPNERIRKVYRDVTLVVGHADTHPNADVKREARELVRAVQHLRFEEIESRRSRFKGRLKAAGHARNERRKLESRRRHTIGRPTDDLTVVQLTSSDQLQSAGRALRNCAAHKRGLGWTHHEALREGDSDFYLLEKSRDGVALIEVGTDDRDVLDIRAVGNEDFQLPSRRVGLDLLRKLEATADDIEAFTAVGAFSVFLPRVTRTRRRITVGDDEYRCWCFPEQRQIVLQRRGGPWSSFKWFAPRRPARRGPPTIERLRRPRGRLAGLMDWRTAASHEDALSVGNLVELMRRSRDFRRIVQRAVHTDE